MCAAPPTSNTTAAIPRNLKHFAPHLLSHVCKAQRGSLTALGTKLSSSMSFSSSALRVLSHHLVSPPTLDASLLFLSATTPGLGQRSFRASRPSCLLSDTTLSNNCMYLSTPPPWHSPFLQELLHHLLLLEQIQFTRRDPVARVPGFLPSPYLLAFHHGHKAGVPLVPVFAGLLELLALLFLHCLHHRTASHLPPASSPLFSLSQILCAPRDRTRFRPRRPKHPQHRSNLKKTSPAPTPRRRRPASLAKHVIIRSVVALCLGVQA